MRALLSVSILSLVLAACGSQPPAPEQAPSGVESRTPSDIKIETSPVAKVSPEAFDPTSFAALKDPRSPLSKRTIYFDYDSSQVADSERSKIDTVAQDLKQNDAHAVIIEGNCDERGSNEYNLTLGERRAQAIRAYLAGLGIGADRIQTKSYGEEKPANAGHDEAAWAANRRGEFVLYY